MRTVVAGLGAMGRRHVQAARSLGWEIVACSDPRPESFESAGDLLGDAEKCATYKDALSRGADVAIVASTAPSHIDLALEALQSGAPFVLVEKPLGVSVAECQSLQTATEAGRSRVAVNHPMRFMPVYAEPIKWVTDPRQGGFCSMTVVCGSGGLAMIGSHFIEAFRVTSGSRLAKIQAWLDGEGLPNPRGQEFEDVTGQIRGTTEMGHRLNIDMGRDQGHGIKIIYAARNGVAVVDLLSGVFETAGRQEADLDLPTTRYGTVADRNLTQLPPSDPIAASAAMLQALVSGQPVPTVQDGVDIVACLAAMYHSHESGQSVDVGTEHDPARRFAWA